MAEFKSKAKIRYAIVVHDIMTEKEVFKGEVHLTSITGFMQSLFEHGMLLTQHYRLDPGCIPKIVILG
jgi:hypothetical protein